MSGALRDHVDSHALVARAGRLIATPTTNPPGNEAALANLLAEELLSLGLETTVVPLAENRASVVGRLRGRGDRPALVLSGHLDTVPPGQTGWTRDPYTPELVNGRLYGLGSSDMKGAVAAMVEGAAAIRRGGFELGGDLLLAFSASEEIDSAGAATLVASGALHGAGAFVIGEPTGNGVYVAEKGVAWIEVVTRGQTAHGSMPEKGVNAIYHMVSVIGALEQFRFDRPPHPLLGNATLNVGTIAGGVAPNVVADRCTAMVDMRLVPGQEPEEALGAIRRILDDVGRTRRHFDAEARLVMGRAAVETDPSHPLVRVVLDAASAVTGRRLEASGIPYGTDASVYVLELGTPMVICGPGQAAMAHQPDEYVEVESLALAAEIYVECALRWLGTIPPNR